MARRFFQLAFWAALIQLGIPGTPCRAQVPALQSGSTLAATASPAPAEENHKGERREKEFRREYLTPDQQKKYDSLPPEQQEKMRENWERWQNMSKEERNQLRATAEAHRQKMLQEVDQAIKESGLQLDDKTREEYVQRYTQERRKIEQKLQKEMEEERKPLVQALIARLKAEFEAKSPPASTASPSPAPAATSPPLK